MSPVFSARRRADEFDALLEGRSSQAADPAVADLLELVAAMRELPPVTARPEFVADLRERLMARAATELATSGPSLSLTDDRLTVPQRRAARERRIAVLAGSVAVVGATTSMAVASQSALPGDMLYPVKRAIENAHTGISVGDEQKGSTLLANASGRLDEASALSRQVEGGSASDVAAIEETLATFADQAAEASDLLLTDYERNGSEESVTKLKEFTSSSFDQLTQLAAIVPDEAREALVSAGNVLAGIEASIQMVCPTCDVRLTQIPPWLLAQGGSIQDAFLPPVRVDERSGAPAPGPKSGREKGGEPAPALPDLDGPLGELLGAGGGATGDAPQPGGGSGGSGSGGTGSGGTGGTTQDPLGGALDPATGGGSGSGDPLGEVLEDVDDVVDDVTGLLVPPSASPTP